MARLPRSRSRECTGSLEQIWHGLAERNSSGSRRISVAARFFSGLFPLDEAHSPLLLTNSVG